MHGVSTARFDGVKFIQGILLVCLTHMCMAAPGVPGSQREESADVPPSSVTLANPFGSNDEDRRLLQNYLQANMKDNQGGPELSNREQEVFFLFRLYDFDRSGHMDGLEMMKLLADYNSHSAHGELANESVRKVVSLVDFLLQTHDLNQDGLLAPSELLSPPQQHSKDPKTDDAPQQEQEVVPEEKPVEGEVKEEKEEGEKVAEEQQGQEAHQPERAEPTESVALEQEDQAPEGEKHLQEEVDEPVVDKVEGVNEAPVHQGQPEM